MKADGDVNVVVVVDVETNPRSVLLRLSRTTQPPGRMSIERLHQSIVRRASTRRSPCLWGRGLSFALLPRLTGGRRPDREDKSEQGMDLPRRVFDLPRRVFVE